MQSTTRELTRMAVAKLLEKQILARVEQVMIKNADAMAEYGIITPIINIGFLVKQDGKRRVDSINRPQ